MNEQKPNPAREWDGKYLVHSMFLTIQGEGPFSGEGAVFVRLAGCNIQCPFCDTEYSDIRGRGEATAQQIVNEIGAFIGVTATTLVVITGGEPFRQDLTELVAACWLAGYRVQIETNGTMTPSDEFKRLVDDNLTLRPLGVVVSPKAHYVDPWIEAHAIAFKYVLSWDSLSSEDGLPISVLGRAGKQVARPHPGFALPIYIQPADMGDDTTVTRLNKDAVVNSAIRYGYRAQLQIHKNFGVE